MISIKLRSLEGKIVDVKIPGSSKCSDIKRELTKLANQQIGQIRLVYQNQLLMDDMYLRDIDYKPDHLIVFTGVRFNEKPQNYQNPEKSFVPFQPNPHIEVYRESNIPAPIPPPIRNPQQNEMDENDPPDFENIIHEYTHMGFDRDLVILSFRSHNYDPDMSLDALLNGSVIP